MGHLTPRYLRELYRGFALLTRQREALIGASTTLVMPLTFLSGAFLSLRLVPGWIAGIARFNPVSWAASAGRIAVASHPAWGTIGCYAGFLALALAVTAVAATRAFRTYQGRAWRRKPSPCDRTGGDGGGGPCAPGPAGGYHVARERIRASSDDFQVRRTSEPVPGSAHREAPTMADETVSATTIMNAPAEAIFAVLADPARHAAIDGTGWVREPLDSQPLTAAGQVFRMAMYHPARPDGNYQMANRVKVFDPPRVISWEPGQDSGDGSLRFGGWVWRYDLAPAGPSQTRVTLSYDWSAVPGFLRQRIGFPPFPPDHLSNSLAHLASLVAA